MEPDPIGGKGSGNFTNSADSHCTTGHSIRGPLSRGWELLTLPSPRNLLSHHLWLLIEHYYYEIRCDSRCDCSLSHALSSHIWPPEGSLSNGDTPRFSPFLFGVIALVGVSEPFLLLLLLLVTRKRLLNYPFLASWICLVPRALFQCTRPHFDWRDSSRDLTEKLFDLARAESSTKASIHPILPSFIHLLRLIGQRSRETTKNAEAALDPFFARTDWIMACAVAEPPTFLLLLNAPPQFLPLEREPFFLPFFQNVLLLSLNHLWCDKGCKTEIGLKKI